MEKKLVIPFGKNKIVAMIDDNNLPDIPPELWVYVEDENGVCIKDICLVREHYFWDDDGESHWVDKFIDCLIWGSPHTDDYTNDFIIGINERE